jgi:hypothetical protein
MSKIDKSKDNHIREEITKQMPIKGKNSQSLGNWGLFL